MYWIRLDSLDYAQDLRDLLVARLPLSTIARSLEAELALVLDTFRPCLHTLAQTFLIIRNSLKPAASPCTVNRHMVFRDAM